MYKKKRTLRNDTRTNHKQCTWAFKSKCSQEFHYTHEPYAAYVHAHCNAYVHASFSVQLLHGSRSIKLYLAFTVSLCHFRTSTNCEHVRPHSLGCLTCVSLPLVTPKVSRTRCWPKCSYPSHSTRVSAIDARQIATHHPSCNYSFSHNWNYIQMTHLFTNFAF